MPKYYVKTIVEYSNEVEADSPEAAEQLGWDFDTELMYDGVYSIDVEELEDDEDDEDDLRVEDDVEADLSAILQEKLTTPQEVPAEDEEEVLSDDRTDGLERLQPRRADEVQCTQCFLLVRSHAPGCPVEDDHCPLFR